MAVTKSIHAVVAPWGVSGLANAFKDAFIAAGLMSDWHDSFTSGGFEHRILEVVYDNTKTYGTCYYWFILDGVGARVKTVTGWDTVNNIPKGPTSVGAQTFDWPENVTAINSVNSTQAGTSLLTLSNSINLGYFYNRPSGHDLSTLVLRCAYRWLPCWYIRCKFVQLNLWQLDFFSHVL